VAGDIVFGLNAVTEALSAGRGINRIYIAKESHVRGIDPLLDEARARKVPFDFVPQAKLNELTGTREHQGIAAAVSPLEYTTLNDCLSQCPPEATLLVLDQVQHPKNLGMLIRSAAAAGASGVLLTARGGALLDESVVRASAGTVFHVPVVPCGNLSQALRTLQDANFWIYGLDAKGPDNIFDVKWPARCALVVGNESEGLRPGVAKACDHLIHIPLAREIDSLNAAIAASVALFQVAATRHRR
jgi:23S rRNA (guanosine2251-2'-O)-methyltransferase